MRTFIETLENDILTVQKVAEQSYGELLENAWSIADGVDLGDYTYPTFSLLEDLREHDEDAAIGGLRTLPIALEIAEETDRVTNSCTDKRWQFITALLHDIGKVSLPKQLLQKSSRGEEWTAQDMEATRPHAESGGKILFANGFPEVVCRAVAGHHSKQLGSNEYGLDLLISDEARIYRDCTAVADFVEASENRINSRNKDLSVEQRHQYEIDDIAYVYDDYEQKNLIIEKVIIRTLGQSALI